MSHFDTIEDYQRMLETSKLWYVQVIIWAYLEALRIMRVVQGKDQCQNELDHEAFFRRLVAGEVVIREEQLEGLNPDRMNLVHYVKLAERRLANGRCPLPAGKTPDDYLADVFDYEWEHDGFGKVGSASERPRPLPTPE